MDGAFCPGAVPAGIDATGFETRHAASYAWRTGFRHEYTKLSACSEAGTQLVMAAGWDAATLQTSRTSPNFSGR